MQKATDLLIQCLENEGVEYVFGIMGKETLDLMDSLSRSNIKFINVRHEQGAAFMADVYARLTKKAGVCLATLGPGAANLLTGIASANLDHSPVVAITGQAGFEKQHEESHQYIDNVKVFEPVTKWSVQVKDTQTVPTIIRQAFRVAQMEKPGAVFIELPENIAPHLVPNQPLSKLPLPKSIPAPQALADTLTLIGQSQKPVVLLGNGVIRQRAVPGILHFVEKLQAPVVHSFMAKGILPNDHPLNYFTFGFSQQDEAVSLMEQADLIITAGFDLVESPPKDWNPSMHPILHIDALPAETDEHYPVTCELVGDLHETFQGLNAREIPAKPWVPDGQLKERIRSAYHIGADVNGNSPHSIENILTVIEKNVPENTVIVSDVGAHKLSIARTYQPKLAGRLIISNGFASMGIALPGAIGAKLACQGDPVICITGDGGALMNISELETANRLNLSFIVIVLNNSTLKLEEQMMQEKFNSSYGTKFENPDFVKLAESFGVNAVIIHQLNEFEQALKNGLEQTNGISLIDVQLGPDGE